MAGIHSLKHIFNKDASLFFKCQWGGGEEPSFLELWSPQQLLQCEFRKMVPKQGFDNCSTKPVAPLKLLGGGGPYTRKVTHNEQIPHLLLTATDVCLEHAAMGSAGGISGHALDS